MSEFHTTILEYFLLVQDLRCSFSYSLIGCGPSYYIAYFILGLLLLLPFYYIGFDKLRKQYSTKHNLTNQMVCYCIFFTFGNMVAIVINFTGGFIIYSVLMEAVTKVNIFSKMIQNYSYFCFFLNIAQFLSMTESGMFKWVYLVLRCLYYGFLILFVFFFLISFIDFSDKFDMILLNISIPSSFETGFSCIMVGLGVIILFQCFVVSKIQFAFSPASRLRLKILIFILCLALLLTIFTGELLYTRQFGVYYITHDPIKPILFPFIYFTKKYAIGYTLLAMIIILSTPPAKEETESEIDLHII